MGVVLCVSVIFSVFHPPGVCEAYCFAMMNNVRSTNKDHMWQGTGASNTLENNLWRDSLRALSTLKLLPTHWPSDSRFSQMPKVKVWWAIGSIHRITFLKWNLPSTIGPTQRRVTVGKAVCLRHFDFKTRQLKPKWNREEKQEQYERMFLCRRSI